MAKREFEIFVYARLEVHYVHILDSLAFTRFIVYAHGLGTTTVQSFPDTQKALTHCWVGEHFGCLYTNIVIFTFLLNFDLVSITNIMLQSCHCLFVSSSEGVSICGDDVTSLISPTT